MFNQLDESKKMRIIQAALAEFAEKGYDGASTIKIAQKAQISKGSLFHYFQTKETLFNWLIQYGIALVESALYANENILKEDFIEVLVQSALIKLKLFNEYPSLGEFFYKIYQDHSLDQSVWAVQYTDVMTRFQSLALNQVNPVKFRNDLAVGEVLQISYWIIDGMAKEYTNTEQDFNPEDMMKLTDNMMTTLKKLLYKEEYQ